MLEVEEIEEEDELEELEEGREPPHKMSRTASPEQEESGHNYQVFKKGRLPVLPYCGCEEYLCHLLPQPRSHQEIRLDKVGAFVLSIIMCAICVLCVFVRCLYAPHTYVRTCTRAGR